jgi:hypothetical protein
MVTGAIFGWSRWVFDITPGRVAMRTDAEIKSAAAVFAREVFVSAFGLSISVYLDGSIVIDARVHGHPVLDPRHVQEMTRLWRDWAIAGFGDLTMLECKLAAQTDEPKGAPLERTA